MKILFAGAADAIPSRFVDSHDERVRDEYSIAVRSYLSRISRIDTALYTARADVIQASSGLVHITTLRRIPPRQSSFQVGGIRRRAYQCGGTMDLETGEVSWVTWDAQRLGGLLPTRLSRSLSRLTPFSRPASGSGGPGDLDRHTVWQSLVDPG